MILCQSWIKTPQSKAAHMRTHSKTQARHRACKLGDTIVIEALSERMLSLALKTKDCLPIIFHADDGAETEKSGCRRKPRKGNTKRNRMAL